MTPVNNKSLLSFIFNQMEKLDKNEIDVKTATAMANLARQAHQSLHHEIARIETMLKIDAHNKEFGTNIKIRNAEGINVLSE